MRLRVEHHTTYRFTEPQARLVQLLRLTPENTHDQTVASWHVDVSCDARLRDGRDGFGNRVTTLYATGPLDGLEITVTGEVLTSHASGVVRGTAEPLPPALFRRSTPATAADAAIRDWTAALGGEGVLDRLHRVNGALHERFGVARERPEPGLTAADAFGRDRVAARDLAQLFCAATRSLGSPARYVSGYRLLGDEHRASPHGWAEAWVDGIGWIGFDPCLGASPEDGHVRVAVALDAAGAAPVAGSRLGEGEERLDVDVSVERRA
jgi:transglutaminase-like putative cysteine protease